MPSQELSGKVCLVTGGAGGLGQKIAEALLDAGARVAVSDINQDLLTACTAAFPSDVFLAVNADVTKEESAAKLFEEIIAKFGQLDVLVNNAGIMDRFDAVGECDFKMWEKVLAVNLTGPFIMTKLAVNHFLSREAKGKILNIGSLSSFRGHTAGVAYTASKHGLLGLTKNTAAAYGKNGIRCNILMPAGMATNIGTAFATAGMNMDRFQKVQTLMAAGEAQMVDTAQLAKTAVFLCSDNAQALNGAEIVADHGFCSN